ncbi:hypothetical protein PC9H_002311 [Pleurotus ostreatus]|uniref:Uncharacterized protein n=1 Tax=Pleurotus ostreatus TaxID=5322 RepID=A0A8H7DKC5_PLEOS|nr:uncharacterized protein PC9H_002311 [Pleurotus ostreatus]KAF7416051.1 hypothetical protein PC9H_002311 [Pleurotus ostreatus]
MARAVRSLRGSSRLQPRVRRRRSQAVGSKRIAGSAGYKMGRVCDGTTAMVVSVGLNTFAETRRKEAEAIFITLGVCSLHSDLPPRTLSLADSFATSDTPSFGQPNSHYSQPQLSFDDDDDTLVLTNVGLSKRTLTKRKPGTCRSSSTPTRRLGFIE